MNTRKYPRTLNEAFGPYAHIGPIEEPKRPMDWQDKVVLVGSVVAFFGFLAVIFLGQ